MFSKRATKIKEIFTVDLTLGASMVYDFLFINLSVYPRKIIPKIRTLTSKARWYHNKGVKACRWQDKSPLVLKSYDVKLL